MQFAKYLLAAGFTAGVAVGSAEAALVITNGDIVANQYKFTMLYSEIGPAVSPDPGAGNYGAADPTTSKFNSTVFQSTNMYAAADGTGTGERRFVVATNSPNNSGANTATSAFATFKFDFSGTSYRPTSVQWGKRFNVDPQTPNTNAVRTKIEWSYDNATWTNIFTSNDPDTSTPYRDGGYSQDFNPVPSVALSGTDAIIYYRVSFDAATSTAGTTPTNLSGRTVQWGRQSSTNNWNVADFTVTEIPEPTSLAATVCLGGTLLTRRRRSGDAV